MKLQQFHRKAKSVLVKEQFMGKYNICMDNMHENALFSEKIFYTTGKNLHDKFQLCEHSYVKWLIFE